MVVEVWSTPNTCPDWSLLWIDTRILAVGFWIAGIIVGRLKKRVVMRFMNEWKYNTMLLERKFIIWQLFGWYIYYPFFLVATEVSDVSADVGACLRAVKTLLTKIHVSFAKWTVTTMLRNVWTVFCRLTPLQASSPRKKPHHNLLFPKRGPTTLVGFLSSSFTHLQSVFSLAQFQHPLDLEKHTASAFSLSRRLFCILTTPSAAHCLIYGCHFMLSSYLTWTVHSPVTPTQRSHHGVQELEQGQTSEIWLQSMLLVVFVMNLSIQLTNQGT